MSNSTYSLERRLFEALVNHRGIVLSKDDVFELLFDDAIGTRITNQACAEAGVAESGVDDVAVTKATTWKQFVLSQLDS